MVLYAAAFAILVTMGIAVIIALRGPSVYDRLLAANMFGTKTVLLLSVVALIFGRPEFLDLALAYALINFIAVLAVLEFAQSRALRRVIEDAHHREQAEQAAAQAAAHAAAPRGGSQGGADGTGR
jgi:multicomponent Na+:H+ antiporter subunit F